MEYKRKRTIFKAKNSVNKAEFISSKDQRWLSAMPQNNNSIFLYSLYSIAIAIIK